VEGSAVRPSVFSNPSSEAIPDKPSPPIKLYPATYFAMADCCIRLANKINAARLTNSVIWTALFGNSCDFLVSGYGKRTPAAEENLVNAFAGEFQVSQRRGLLAPRTSAEAYDLFCRSRFCFNSPQIFLSLRGRELKPGLCFL
jgi:hypothetical protein